jgi:hypothetical protein
MPKAKAIASTASASRSCVAQLRSNLVKTKLREHAGDEVEEDDFFAMEAEAPAVEPPRLGGYRSPGDIEVRAKELEQALIQVRARNKELELEIWRARKSARSNRALLKTTLVASSAGVGAALASVVALALYSFGIVTSPPLLLGIIVAGTSLRVLLDMRKAGVDDNFPDAPPPRLH